jgi:hypothetical protein
MSIMGWILETSPNTPWISSLVTMVIKIKYSILTYNYVYKRNPNYLIYVITFLNFLKKSNNHLKVVKSLLDFYATWWFYDFEFFSNTWTQ